MAFKPGIRNQAKYDFIKNKESKLNSKVEIRSRSVIKENIHKHQINNENKFANLFQIAESKLKIYYSKNSMNLV